MNKAMMAIAGLCAVLATAGVSAQDSADTEKPLTGDVRLGYENTSGNTDTSSLGGEVNLKYIREIWEFSGRVSGSGRQDNNVTTEERYHGRTKAQRFFGDKKNYAYGEILYDRDRFGGVTRQVYETLGYGRRIIDTGTQQLNLEIGAGFRQSRLSNGIKENGAIVQLGGDYQWQINDHVMFKQELTVNHGSDNTYTMSLTTLETQLVGNLNLIVGYRVDNNSDVPAGNTETDTKTTLAVAYKF